MLCVGECEFQNEVGRRKNLLSRIFQRNSGMGRAEALDGSSGEFVQVSRAGAAILGKGELCIVNMTGRCKICCARGAAWVTCTGYPRDYILNAGEDLFFEGEGKIVISGGSADSLIRICNG